MSSATIVIIALSMLAFSGNSVAMSPTLAGSITAGGAQSAAAPAGPAGASAPTYAGLGSGIGFSGPFVGTPAIYPAGAALPANDFPSISPLAAHYPSLNPKAGLAAAAVPDVVSGIPVVSCSPMGPGCDKISGSSGGAVTDPYGLSAVANGGLYGEDVEPPDQGLCAGNGYVMEVINIGELRVFNAHFGGGTSEVTLDSLMGLTGLGWSSGGDIMCLYDANNGGHWFITEFVSTTSEGSGGVFSGCFAAVYDTSREGLAVSVTNNPEGAYNVYFIDPNAVNSDPGTGYFLNDFAKMGNTRDALLFFYDEFNQNGATIPACPAYGCLGFNGAQEFAIDKNALELGYPAGSPYFTVAYENLGLVPTPDGSCNNAVFTCWIQVIPATSPDPAQFDNHYGGTGFMVGSLDFFGVGDTRIAVFYWFDLSKLNSINCDACGAIGFGGQLFAGLETYLNEGGACPASAGGYCGLGAQKKGPIPLGNACVAYGLASGVASCPEGGIATNGDGVTQVSYSAGQIWTAVSTLVNQTYGTGTCPATAQCEIHVGAAYWAFGTGTFNSVGYFSLTTQGYVSAAHEDLEFPAIAAGDTASQGAVISFTLSGNGGPWAGPWAGYCPSSAYGRLTAWSGGLVGTVIHITALGKSPQDGFTEYQGYPYLRPRWGDYGQAIYVPGAGFYFAAEYIEHPNCGNYAFSVDPSCGATRDPYANFGTSIS